MQDLLIVKLFKFQLQYRLPIKQFKLLGLMEKGLQILDLWLDLTFHLLLNKKEEEKLEAQDVGVEVNMKSGLIQIDGRDKLKKL